jgi:hypothetical protein
MGDASGYGGLPGRVLACPSREDLSEYNVRNVLRFNLGSLEGLGHRKASQFVGGQGT